MLNINQVELQNLKHFITTANTFHAKYTAYAETCNNAQIKQLLNKVAQDSLNEKETLITFFNN